MSTSAGTGARPRRILVIANETCAAPAVVDEVRYRGGEGADVMVVAPALARSRLEHWLTADLEARQAAAAERLEVSVNALREAGFDAGGGLGDADPLQALDDALRVFDPDEVVISTHPPARSNWLERQVVRRARERYTVPITHVVVDLEHETTSRDPAEAQSQGRRPPARQMRVFHSSDYDEALAIQAQGFRDHAGGASEAGVWVSDRPPTAGDGHDWVVFAVDVPEDAAAAYERSGDGDGGRRFLLPAELLNRHGPPVAEGDWSE
ncbi:MAG: hypothetical protein AB7V62_15510 [Thermoleophilia bacterium]